ncbi:TetR/AcrR family transcriptional regulator [Mycobacterium avium]|uniref:TetR/AcrR family transcriptional regulator n=1 Tax=Mycobacterium avium TaxID=1764 RepID=UPI001CC811D8|nr:TetR/AcrR family transcriptional regulator [Mycobacterium avium]MBZ4521869.1 TetR/AcrR family transcriptional regulator [Mycobacterium avium subsp. hominissuis]MBZ4531252.1 TetR/AcrR family transcriptional regulator [Mycobacterium avium subsp. hominissuis]
MVKTDATERTRQIILDAAARLLSQRPDAGMADIAEEAGVGRATLYRHFATRESLLRGIQDAGSAELVAAFEAAGLDSLPADRAITRITGIFLRTGTKYAAVISQEDEHREHAARDRAVAPIRDTIARGIRDGELRGDLPGIALFEMYSALIARAQLLTITGRVTPEQGADAVVAVFLEGALKR